MIKQAITFEGFDGEEVTEEHYFHLSKKDLINMEFSEEGGLGERMTQTVKSGDVKQIIDMFNMIISKSYGIRDPASPGKFVKSEEISKGFMDSLAYDKFLGDLLTDTKLAIDFANGVVPKDLVGMLEKIQADEAGEGDASPSIEQVEAEMVSDERSGLEHPRNVKGELLPWALRKPTKNELRGMTREQLLDVTARMNSDWVPVVQ
jgi:hypothetical protein